MVVDIPALLKAAGDAGGWAVAVAVSVTVIGLLVRGRLIPESVYRREAARADRAEERLERATRLLAGRKRTPDAPDR